MKNGFGCNVNAGLKPLAQYMEAISTSSIHRLRADERVEFIRLSRTEAGIYPADLRMKSGLGRNVHGPTRPSGTLPKSAIEITQVS